MVLIQRELRLALSLMERLPVAEEFDWRKGGLSGGEGNYAAAWVPSSADAAFNYVFNLPQPMKTIFLAITNGDPKEVAQALATLEDMERNSIVLQWGSYVQMPDPYLKSHNRVAICCLKPDTLQIDPSLPDEITVDEETHRLLLVIFISEDEYAYKQQHGHLSLMEKFDRDKRNLAEFL
jgi:hypothetical protein